jgi:HEAT repeat protein
MNCCVRFADPERIELFLMWFSAAIALSMIALVILERVVVALLQLRRRALEHEYQPIIALALAGDQSALLKLASVRSWQRVTVARLLIEPLIADPDPARIARTRAIARAMAVVDVADRYMRSFIWWRRALALRALGLIQANDRTGAIVAALDDANVDVRAAALDALANLHDPATLSAVVVRLNDASLHRGRRLAALAAFGAACEPLLLQLAGVDPAHRVVYARAIGVCGTAASRPALAEWSRDARPDVRSAAFEALARIGLDDRTARLAIGALDNDETSVRAAAAAALHGWSGAGDAAAHLAEHLDDAWPVAVLAARSLRSMGPAGALELKARADRTDLSGLLARQMLWQPS